MRLFYDSNINSKSHKHQLSESESKHIIRVLRMKKGNELGVLDGKGNLFYCEIIEESSKSCVLKINETLKSIQTTNEIHIAISPPKKMDRIEWFIEKSTEIGITEFSFIQCKNSERISLKTNRLEKKAISAMKQSNQRFLPRINSMMTLEEFITKNPKGLIANCHDLNKEKFSDVFELKKCPILIGPEGGFSLEEIKFANNNGYKNITLGKNRLRTETAGIYSCIQAKILMND